jgi:hypothetical protein
MIEKILKVPKNCHPEAVFPRGISRDVSVLNARSRLFYENRSLIGLNKAGLPEMAQFV